MIFEGNKLWERQMNTWHNVQVRDSSVLKIAIMDTDNIKL